jgi:hypothetical protein
VRAKVFKNNYSTIIHVEGMENKYGSNCIMGMALMGN